MPSETPTDGRCNAELDGGYCLRYPSKDDNGEPVNGRCPNHGGKSTGPPEGNLNALKSGAFASPEFIQQGIENGHPKLEQYQDQYIAFFEALCTRHERFYGREPDDFLKSRYRRFVTFDIMERLLEDYLDEQLDSGESGNPLVEEGFTEDGMPIDKANKLLDKLSDWSREIRLGLKDFGLLQDPTSKQADATRSLSEVLSEESN